MKLEKIYKCWTCKEFSYKLIRKYGHCNWLRTCVLLFKFLHLPSTWTYAPKPEDECKGYEKGKPRFS